jgi:5-methylcytosine-specific restriction endonuclease McrA
MKFCSTCKNKKDLSLFCANKNSKDKKSSQCKLCAKEYRENNKKIYPSKSKESKKIYYNKNKNNINELRRNNHKNKLFSMSKKDLEDKKKKNHEKYLFNKEKVRLSQSESYFKNKEYHSNRNKIYRQNNKERISLRNRARRLKLSKSKITQKEINDLIIEHNSCCYYCSTQVKSGINLHLDHKVPLSLGGENKIENLVPSCKTCNLRKGTKTDVEFKEFLKKGLICF